MPFFYVILCLVDIIERFANLKNIDEYINRIDEMIAQKVELFSKN